MEQKLKHLEFIQNVITRMNSNSFMLKGWAITIFSALYALAAKDANKMYVAITYFTTPMFWVIDGFYLSQERQYRDLYKRVAGLQPTNIDLSMNATPFDHGRNTWLRSIFSKTLSPFYGGIFLVTLLIMFLAQ